MIIRAKLTAFLVAMSAITHAAWVGHASSGHSDFHLISSAHARDGGGKGGGGAGGSGKGAGNSSAGKSSSASASRASTSDSRAVASRSSEAQASKGEGQKGETGVIASLLKSLNAFHASLVAKENANPNSRVAKVAAYQASIQATNAAQLTLSDLKAQLAGLSAPYTAEQIASAQSIVQADITYQQAVASLQQQIAAALEADKPALQAQLDALVAPAGVEEAKTVLSAYAAYEQQQTSLATQIAEATTSVGQAQISEQQALAGAYNQPVESLTAEQRQVIRDIMQ